MANIIAVLNMFVAFVKKLYDVFGMTKIFDELTRLL